MAKSKKPEHINLAWLTMLSEGAKELPALIERVESPAKQIALKQVACESTRRENPKMAGAKLASCEIGNRERLLRDAKQANTVLRKSLQALLAMSDEFGKTIVVGTYK